jgi:outer membrane protein TolC
LIGFAKADLFPHFSLFGSIGIQAASKVDSSSSKNSGFHNLFKGDSLAYFAGPSINWDLFNYGRISNRVRVEDARFQALMVNYQNVVLEAAQEVEDAMIGFLLTQDAVVFLADGVKASKRSVELSLIQYREGLVDYQRVLDTQRFLTEQQDTLVTTAGVVVENLIAMYKALGGGWEIREGKDFVPETIKAEMEQRTDWGNLLTPQAVQTVAAEGPPSWFNRPDW